MGKGWGGGGAISLEHDEFNYTKGIFHYITKIFKFNSNLCIYYTVKHI